ncbi:MAG: PIN domain-containing protein [Myxococcota bacterium]|nr:PIN domain-containing protein [Myxococcota bacterium]
MRTFIDTNVLVYADDAGHEEKQAQARAQLYEVISRGEAVLSTQVLQEFFSIATRKLGMTAQAARARVETLARLDLVRIEAETILAAIDLHRLRQLSFWDALVIRAAVAGGCERVLTEDLSHGERYDGVLAENPFRAR